MPAPPPSRRRCVAVTLAALVLVALTAPLLPDATSPQPAITPQAGRQEAATAGRNEVTAQMRAEIDRVVAEGSSIRASAESSPYQRARAAARCATFDGQRYCLGVGWTTQSPEQVAARLAAPAPPGRERTGDLDPGALLQRQGRMTPAERAAAERAELTDAAESVAKVWLLRHEIQGVPLPADFAERYPEAAAALPAASARTAADYPETAKILKEKQVRPQRTTYWCGPTTMQMIAWGWRDRRQGQALWADRLRTTSAGTAITDMVRVVNNNTGYDRPEHAGPYVALDIADFTFEQWYLLMMKHIDEYAAPVVLHPILLKRYFPYLDDDASGHFQVGRGFDQDPGGNPQIGYFEPWDQSRFDPSEPRIPRTQWRSAYKSYRANQAHFQSNVGV